MWIEGLGREINVVPIAAGRGLRLDLASAVTFVTTASDTFTITAAPSFAGSYTAITPSGTTLADHGVNVYKSSATNGSAAWVKDNTLIQASPNGHTIVSGGAIATCFCIGADILPDGQRYVKVSVGGSGLVTAIFHDLQVQRTPPNLAILSA